MILLAWSVPTGAESGLLGDVPLPSALSRELVGLHGDDDEEQWDDVDPAEDPNPDFDSPDVWSDWDPEDDAEPEPEESDFWVDRDEDEW